MVPQRVDVLVDQVGGKSAPRDVAAMGQKETKVTDLCSELAITRQTLYRHGASDGTLRQDGLKVVEGRKDTER